MRKCYSIININTKLVYLHLIIGCHQSIYLSLYALVCVPVVIQQCSVDLLVLFGGLEYMFCKYSSSSSSAPSCSP